MFWIQCETDTDNTLIGQLLLSSTYPELFRTVQVPVLCHWGAVQGRKREHGHDSWAKLAKGVLQTTECHVQSLNWGSWLGGADHCWEMGWASVSGWKGMILCITCFSWISFFPFLLSHFSLLLLITITFTFILITKLFLPNGFYLWFSSLSWCGGKGKGSEWLAAWCSVASWD